MVADEKGVFAWVGWGCDVGVVVGCEAFREGFGEVQFL